MYSWPFSPSSWTHFLFHHNTIHNDRTFRVLQKSFYHVDEYSKNQKKKKKRRGKPDVSHKGALWTQVNFEGKWGSQLWATVTHSCQTQTAQSAPWGCGVGLVGCKVLMLLAVRHQKEGFCFVSLFCCCFGRSMQIEVETQTINNNSFC